MVDSPPPTTLSKKELTSILTLGDRRQGVTHPLGRDGALKHLGRQGLYSWIYREEVQRICKNETKNVPAMLVCEEPQSK